MLGVVAMAGLRPWATSSIVPTLIPSPGASVALGDAAVVARAGSPGVGTGGVAAPASPTRVAAPVAVSAPEQRASRSQPVLAVSAGRAVQAATPVPVAAPPASEPPPPSPEPVVVTPPPPPQAPAAPLVASVPSGSPGTAGRPGTSVVGGGAPEQGCEGDEYVIAVTYEEVEGEEGVDYEEAEADILVKRLEADGSATELHLRGDLTDVRDLIATLVSEGNCVQVDVEPPESDSAEEGSEAGVDAAEPDEVPEVALP